MSHTYVLVPGTWMGGWAWHPVARELERRGHRVVAPTMPGMSLGDNGTVSLEDATDHLVAEIERFDLSKVVLVAHNWSGYPVTAAAHRVGARIARLVYWSAFVPLARESMLDAIPDDDREALTGARTADNRVLVPLPRWESRFVQTAPAAVKRMTYRMLRPFPWSYLSQSLTPSQGAITDLPASYIVGAQDLALPEGPESWADKYAPRLGVPPVTFDACHAANLTNPEAVAAQLISTGAS
jgi:pimeloyl-ACP methyl ester carboxylesterase